MTTATLDDPVAALRAFNRFYTRRIGVLHDGLLRTPHPLAEARVLYELGHRHATEVGDIRRGLGMDGGQLSRLLSRLEAEGLVTRERSESDGRRQRIRLTARGAKAHALLDSRSTEENRVLLGGLDARDQERLLAALQAVQEILSDEAPRRAVNLRAPTPGDLGWIVERHGVLYAQEYGWNASFEALVASIVPDIEAAWIAEVDGRRAGCVLCVRRDERCAQLRCLLVEPWARGLGIGARLVDECLQFARGQGYEEIMLWTNDILHTARRIYERAGFELVEETPHHSFSRDLVGQSWSRLV